MIKNSHVFNPQNPLEQAVQDSYHAQTDQWLSAHETISIIESLVGYDGLYDEFLTHPQAVASYIFADNGGDKIYIPCHIVELRQILRKRKIVSSYKIAAFHKNAAQRFWNEYPVLMVFDKAKMPNALMEMSGITIFDKVLEFGHALVRVMCLEKYPDIARAMDEIVQQEYPQATTHMMTDVPGMKAAQILPQKPLRKFVVNIGALGIEDWVIKTTDPEHAVEEALAKRRQNVENAENDPQLTLHYWKNSPYWPMIVKEANVIIFQLTDDPPRGTLYG